MELLEYTFPKLTKVDLAFSTVKTDGILLEEAKSRGYYNGNTEYNKLFSELFCKGGKMVFKEGLDEEKIEPLMMYTICLMKSFEPKHEEKEAVCAMLMAEFLVANK